MKIYMPKIDESKVGGGWTFMRNFRRGMIKHDDVIFVDTIEEADIVFIPGVTLVERDDIELAKHMGKKIVFRADNVPRKSRNRRSRVFDNMKRYGEIADLVIYQSEWSREYCLPLSGEGEVIMNGVDTELFHKSDDKPDHPIYLFAFHGKNESKGFGLAHYLFETYHRKDPSAEFWFIYNFKSEIGEQMDANYDFWNGEKFRHLPPVTSQEAMADLLRQCTHLIYPAYADAAPNMVLEARACGLQVVGTLDPAWSGVSQMLNISVDISLERMCNEYFGMFYLLVNEPEPDREEA